MARGAKALLVVVVATAIVLTPLILGGVLLGFYVGDQVGYSKSILAIVFSTIGFVAGIFVIFRVIDYVVKGSGKPDR